jgi:hypothetical protein
MLTRWMYSQFFRNSFNQLVPVCSAYGARWFCPQHPASDDGWALVQIWTSFEQIEAAKQDPRIVICGNNDFSKVPDQVIAGYAQLGATPGMSMGELRSTLADAIPLFLHELS